MMKHIRRNNNMIGYHSVLLFLLLSSALIISNSSIEVNAFIITTTPTTTTIDKTHIRYNKIFTTITQNPLSSSSVILSASSSRQQRRGGKRIKNEQQQQQQQPSPIRKKNTKMESIQYFFSSTAIRKRRLDVHPEDVVTELSNDGFLKIVTPNNNNNKVNEELIRLSAISRSTSAFDEKKGCVFGRKLRREPYFQQLRVPEYIEDIDFGIKSSYHPSILRAVRALEIATENINIIGAFDERKVSGGGGNAGLRGVQCQVTTEDKVSLALVWYAETLKDAQPALTRLVKELQRIQPDLWHNIWCHCNDDEDDPRNRRRAKFLARNPKGRWFRLVGPEFVRRPLLLDDEADGSWLYTSPLASSSSSIHNVALEQRMARDVAILIPGGSRICDLYSGVGLFGLTALASAYHSENDPLECVRFSGENDANKRCFQRSLRSLPSQITGLKPKNKKYNKREQQRRRREQQMNDDDDEDESNMSLAEMTKLLSEDPSWAQDDDDNDDEYYQEVKAKYTVSTASDVIFEKGGALGCNVMIVNNPPSNSIDERLLEELCKKHDPDQEYVTDVDYVLEEEFDTMNWCNDVETLIYISKNFPTKDLEELLLSSENNWMLQSATGYQLRSSKSNTNKNNISGNMEIVIVLQRSLNKQGNNKW